MKSMTHKYAAAALLGGFLATAGFACAQDATSQTTTTTSTTSTAGTVSDFTPGVITVRSDTTSAPVAYSYSKTTTYVDENGNPVSSETVKSGAPVTVFYTQDGGQMVASKVVVHKTVTTDGAPVIIQKKTTTTTTSPSSNQ